MSTIKFADLNLSRHAKMQVGIIDLAVQLGYRLTQSPNLIVTLHPPVDGQSIQMPPVRQFNDAKAKTFTKKVIRYGDPKKVTEMEKRVAQMTSLTHTKQEQAQARAAREAEDANKAAKLIKEQQEAKKVADIALTTPLGKVTVGGLRDGRGPDHPMHQSPAAKKTAPPPPPNFPSVQTPDKPARWIVSISPRVVKQNNNISGTVSVYDSDAVLVRTWSDGYEDYQCAWTGCEYTHESARSVSNHYGATKSHNPVPDPHRMVDPTLHAELAHSAERRIARLTAELEEALQWVDDTKDGSLIAEEVARHIIVKRDEKRQADMEDHEPHEMGPEDILERIRRLVDGGAYLTAQRAAQEARDQLSALEDENLALQEKYERQQKALDRTRSDLKALRELVNSVDDEEEESA